MTSRKKIALIATSLILIGAIALVVLYFTNNNKSKTTQTTPTTVQNKQAADSDASKKQDVINNTQTSTPSDTTPNQQSIVIDSSQNGSDIIIVTKLYGYSDGSCALNVSNKASSLTQNAQIIFQPEYSTCEGFSVPTDKLGTGTWTIDLSVKSNNTTTTKQVYLVVK